MRIEVREDETRAIHAEKDLVFGSPGNIPRDAHNVLEQRVRDGFDTEGVDNGERLRRSFFRERLKLHCCDDFFQLAKNPGAVGGLFGGIGNHGDRVCNLEIKFIACAVEEGGVHTGRVVHMIGEVTRLPPMKEDAVDCGSASGIPCVRIDGSGEGLTRFGLDHRINDELEIAPAKCGVGIGIVGNQNCRDEDGTWRLADQPLERLQFPRIKLFLEFEISGIAERHSVIGIVISGER